MAIAISLKRLMHRKTGLELQRFHDRNLVHPSTASEFHWPELEEPAPGKHDVPSEAPPLCAAFPHATAVCWRFYRR